MALGKKVLGLSLFLAGSAAAYHALSDSNLPEKHPKMQEVAEIIPEVEGKYDVYACGDPSPTKPLKSSTGSTIELKLTPKARTIPKSAVLFEYHPTYITYLRLMRTMNKGCNIEKDDDCLFYFLLSAKLRSHLEYMAKHIDTVNNQQYQYHPLAYNTHLPTSTVFTDEFLASFYLKKLAGHDAVDKRTEGALKALSLFATVGAIYTIEVPPLSATFSTLSTITAIEAEKQRNIWNRAGEDEMEWIEAGSEDVLAEASETVVSYGEKKLKSVIEGKTIEAVIGGILDKPQKIDLDLRKMVLKEAFKLLWTELDYKGKLDRVEERLTGVLPDYRQLLFYVPVVPYSCICPQTKLQLDVDKDHLEAQQRIDRLIGKIIQKKKLRKSRGQLLVPADYPFESIKLKAFPFPSYDSALAAQQKSNIYDRKLSDCSEKTGILCPSAENLVRRVRKILPASKKGLHPAHRQRGIFGHKSWLEKYYTLDGNASLAVVEDLLGLKHANVIKKSLQNNMRLPNGDYASSLGQKKSVEEDLRMRKTNKLHKWFTDQARELQGYDYLGSQSGSAMMAALLFNLDDKNGAEEILRDQRLPKGGVDALYGIVRGEVLDEWNFLDEALYGAQDIFYQAFGDKVWRDKVPRAIAECLKEDENHKWKEVLREFKDRNGLYRFHTYRSNYRDYGFGGTDANRVISLHPTMLMALGYLACECNAPLLKQTAQIDE